MTACRARDDRRGRQAAGGKNAALNVLIRKGRRVMGLRAHSDTKGSGGRWWSACCCDGEACAEERAGRTLLDDSRQRWATQHAAPSLA